MTGDGKRVCIVGAGVSGLMAAKACLEEGMTPVCYEVDRALGGLWRYKESPEDGLASVMRSTIINTSKELSAFSDFPPQEELPNFMHNTKMLKYFEMYAENFDLVKHIKFRRRVVRAVPAEDYDATGRWDVTVKDLESGGEEKETFDGMMVCTGHHGFPSMPAFPGLEHFQGRVIHSHQYKVPNGFEDKSVLVVGIGNSGVDVAVELSQVTDKVFLSTRNGSWVAYRVGPDGLPSDGVLLNRFFNTIFSLFPLEMSNMLVERRLNKIFDHERYGLKPAHGYFQQHPTVNDALPNRILSGTVKVKGNVKEFAKNGVIFYGENEVTPIDAAVFCTGYKIKFPFLSEDIVKIDHNKVELYKYVYPPRMKHPSLGLIGLTQPIGALMPANELQCRWFARVLSGKAHLPSKEDMLKDIEAKRKAMASRYVQSERHTIQVDWINYMDELASMIGVKPKIPLLSVTDPELFLSCMLHPCMPYQYRLTGPHSWPGARQAILGYFHRVNAPLKTRGLEPPLGRPYSELIISLFLGILAYLTHKVSCPSSRLYLFSFLLLGFSAFLLHALYFS